MMETNKRTSGKGWTTLLFHIANDRERSAQPQS